MTVNEQELIDTIRNSDNPQQATMIAIDIICQYITRHRGDGVPLDNDEQTN